MPGTRPASRTMRATSRVEVVLPLVPVTSAIGIGRARDQAIVGAAGSGTEPREPQLRARPVPTEIASSSTGRGARARGRRSISVGEPRNVRAVRSRADRRARAPAACRPATRPPQHASAHSLSSVSGIRTSSGPRTNSDTPPRSGERGARPATARPARSRAATRHDAAWHRRRRSSTTSITDAGRARGEVRPGEPARIDDPHRSVVGLAGEAHAALVGDQGRPAVPISPSVACGGTSTGAWSATGGVTTRAPPRPR